ncbi:hypothetical protein H4Q26_009652 [Puccinia striiformis f. sp. tritici PST-130]|nr:hypothetical protein H4Q26_009652 [Puccinia striiformis f. sp. tritici PST-130]
MKLITLSLLLFPSLQQVFAYFLPHFNGRPVFPPHENVHRDLSAQSNVKPADYPEYQNRSQALTTTLSSSNFTAPTLTTNIYNFLLEIDRIPAANTPMLASTNHSQNGFLVKPFAWMVEKDDASEEAQNPETSTDTKCESGSASQKVHDINLWMKTNRRSYYH